MQQELVIFKMETTSQYGTVDGLKENSFYSHNNDYHSGVYGGYDRNDYIQQDFDDDLDSGMFDDDF